MMSCIYKIIYYLQLGLSKSSSMFAVYATSHRFAEILLRMMLLLLRLCSPEEELALDGGLDGSFGC